MKHIILISLYYTAFALTNLYAEEPNLFKIEEIYLQIVNADSLIVRVIEDPDFLKSKFIGTIELETLKTKDARTRSAGVDSANVRMYNLKAGSIPPDPHKEIEIHFNISSETRSDANAWGSSGLSRFDVLKFWQWYNMPGIVCFNFNASKTNLKQIETPIKLPKSWHDYLVELHTKRNQFASFFNQTQSKTGVEQMKKHLKSPNPIWRMVIAYRLSAISQLGELDFNSLAALSSSYLDIAPLIYNLLKNHPSFKETILKSIDTNWDNKNFLNALSVSSICNVTDDPKAIGYLIGSTRNINATPNSEETKIPSGLPSNFKDRLLSEFMQSPGYQIIYKIKTALVSRKRLKDEHDQNSLIWQALVFLEAASNSELHP